MKTRGVILLFVFVCGFCLAAIPAVSAASDDIRWGISPKKSSRSVPEVAGEKKETSASSKSEISSPKDSSQAMPSNHQEPENIETIPSIKDGKSKSADSTLAPPPSAKELPKQRPPEKKNTSAVKSAPASKKKESKSKPKTEKITWTNAQQKKTCESHLEELNSLFLKTRNYSIQGSSCDTAENATAFLQTWEKSKKECPKTFLDQSGFSNRIIRNISYLEKLGNDRCSETFKPVAPSAATQKKQKTENRGKD